MSPSAFGAALARSYPARWWQRQSLRARLTLISTALFTLAVATGAILLVVIQRYSLVRVLDQSAVSQAQTTAGAFADGKRPAGVITPTVAGVAEVQVVDAAGAVIAHSSAAAADRDQSILPPEQVEDARNGSRYDIAGPTPGSRLRVVGLAVPGSDDTVLVATDLTRVDDSVRILTEAALIGGPLAVLLMGVATYTVVALTLRSVAALRHGASDITAAGLADQRLPVPGPQDEIHRLAVTLNAMLDRIDFATQRQRTFVGDAAHELRSPLASLRVQLEVAQRLSNESEPMIEDVLVDVGRLERLVEDLLALARLDERGGRTRREPVELDGLLRAVVGSYENARVPVRLHESPVLVVQGDPDGLHRVAVNLIDNALRYATTAIDIELVPGSAGPRRMVTLTVTDDGPGLAPEERERVFDRFYRVEVSRSRDSGGTGLGLPIVRDLVRAHGGSIRLTTGPGGGGLSAVVVLPLSPPAE